MDKFILHSEYKPTGDQPQAIEALVRGFQEGNQAQTLLGVTGSGKTFTMANVIQALVTQWNILSPSMRKSQNRWYFVVCGWLNIQMLWKR